MKNCLPWDLKQSAAAAIRNGWRIDRDGWWTRRRRPDDKDYCNSQAGFSMRRGNAYMREALYANEYDRGILHRRFPNEAGHCVDLSEQ